MQKFEPPEPDYNEYTNKQLLAVPIIIFSVAVLSLAIWYIISGLPVSLSMAFIGGVEVRLDVAESVDDPVEKIETTFPAEPDSIAAVSGTNEYIVEFRDGKTSSEQIEDNVAENDKMSIESLSEVSPSLGSDSQKKALQGIGAAFILMSFLVVILFRSVIPAVVIIASAVSDMLVPLAAMNLFGIDLSFGTVGALLMLIGYSVDSDILLNSKVLREDAKKFKSRVHDAMRTGVTMNVTSMSAMIVMTIVAQIFGVGLLRDMGLILSIGLAVDLVNTYMMNVSILRWYTTRGDSK